MIFRSRGRVVLKSLISIDIRRSFADLNMDHFVFVVVMFFLQGIMGRTEAFGGRVVVIRHSSVGKGIVNISGGRMFCSLSSVPVFR